MPDPNVRGFSQLAMEAYAYSQSYIRDGSLHIPADSTQRMSVAGARWAQALNRGRDMRRHCGYGATPVERAYGIPASFREV
jgi:hypothetical protein